MLFVVHNIQAVVLQCCYPMGLNPFDYRNNSGFFSSSIPNLVDSAKKISIVDCMLWVEGSDGVRAIIYYQPSCTGA